MLKTELLEYFLNEVTAKRNIKRTAYSFSNDLEEVLGQARLLDIQKQGDMTTIRETGGNENRYTFFRYSDNWELLKKLVEEQFQEEVISTGYYWYPYGGYCGWHSNSNDIGERIYLVWAQEAGKSFLRYQDPESKKIITDWDQQGWQFKRFTISSEPLFWHCIGSYTNRVSLGFKVLPVPKSTLESSDSAP